MIVFGILGVCLLLCGLIGHYFDKMDQKAWYNDTGDPDLREEEK